MIDGHLIPFFLMIMMTLLTILLNIQYSIGEYGTFSKYLLHCTTC